MASTPEIAADEDREQYISSPSPMGFTPKIAVDEASRELYKALMRGKNASVLQLCQEFPDGSLQVVTIHRDTVLHVATSCKQADWVRDLLKMIKDDQLGKLTIQNKVGNTILHEASTSDKFVGAAEEMLNKAPELLNMCNKFGVTPLYRSVVFGRMDMFKFFDEKIRTQKQTTAHGDLEADK
ncbi:hypothetical protein Vadar_025877 [Vaccinium darrowii]|uniref:Uncharacterized protein n=1 Tax=Vaccinium darrowii TaxID=229202 RepID=A0ACB7Z8S2_9ERIC|nr:hypothetical protein Vadar_025877 [Vaccinium darrowii]